MNDSFDRFTELPDGYAFASNESITAAEIIELRSAVGWQEGSRETWESCLATSIVTGVRDTDESLVGIGFVAGNARHAVICDMAVHPSHQRKGLGTAILEERVRLADRSGIKYLYADPSDKSPLNKPAVRDKLGFISTGATLFRNNVYSE